MDYWQVHFLQWIGFLKTWKRKRRLREQWAMTGLQTRWMRAG